MIPPRDAVPADISGAARSGGCIRACTLGQALVECPVLLIALGLIGGVSAAHERG
jgi:hypothetical protein